MRMRITIPRQGTLADDLRVATEVRRTVWAHSPVKVDPDNPLHGIHRDQEKRTYFEFVTPSPEEIRRVLREHRLLDRVELTEAHEVVGEACQNCGNIAGAVLPTVCPNCYFRDISPCPSCGEEIPRKMYTSQGGRIYRCPNCHTRVRMRFSDPMFGPDGDYNQPLVVVDEVGVHRT